MWIFTTDAFTSAVQHRDDSTKLMVRARDRKSLESLVQTINDTLETAGGEHAYSSADIYREEKSDYRWRIVVTREHYALYVSSEVLNYITYDNFKSAAQKRRTDYFHDVLMDIWVAGHLLTDEEDGKPRKISFKNPHESEFDWDEIVKEPADYLPDLDDWDDDDFYDPAKKA